MRSTKRAFYASMIADSTLASLTATSPYSNGRVPEQGDIATLPIISFHGFSTAGTGSKEDQFVVTDIYGMSGDKVEAVAEELRALFHVKTVRGQWVPLAVAAGKAVVRLESEDDLPDVSTDVVHKVMRWHILFASV